MFLIQIISRNKHFTYTVIRIGSQFNAILILFITLHHSIRSDPEVVRLLVSPFRKQLG